jgi:hypothetical protein
LKIPTTSFAQILAAPFSFWDSFSSCHHCRSGVDTTLARVASDRFFIPKYVGARGWLGLWLDLPKVDWKLVEDVVREAYCLVAPRRLAAKLKDLTNR